MLTIDQINVYFGKDEIRNNPATAFTEYLQYELLDSIFKHPSSARLSFIGGTSIRIMLGSGRFSEGLDFDNFGLDFKGFEKLLLSACGDMKYKGFVVEYRTVEKGAYHCYIRFPKVLFGAGISPDRRRKILIRIDSQKKEAFYRQDVHLLNRFGIYRPIKAAPPSVLLAQKMMTVVSRKREKGRDIYDCSFLFGIVPPDFGFVKKAYKMDKGQFIAAFDRRIKEIDLKYLARDVEPFLFEEKDVARVNTFAGYWDSVKKLIS